MHRQPERDWTVAGLAASVHMSRSVFSDRFTALVGAPPLLYLTRWRMHLAARWLREDRTSLGEVASRLGYESEPSFSRAFKRHIGVPPGAVRRGRDARARPVERRPPLAIAQNRRPNAIRTVRPPSKPGR